MDKMDKKPQKQMDDRCPRELEEFPDTWCPLAVQRLKALRHAGRELSEEEEAALPGCPWGVNHQVANYCFFKLIADHMPDIKNVSDMEVAHYCNISTESVKKIEKRAIDKIRKSDSFREIIDTHDGDSVIESEVDDWEILGE